MKKLLALTLALVLVATPFSGCKKKNADQNEKEELVTVYLPASETKFEYGKETYTNTYEYDKDGNVIQEVRTTPQEDGTTASYTLRYEYPDRDTKIMSRYSDTGELMISSDYSLHHKWIYAGSTYMDGRLAMVTKADKMRHTYLDLEPWCIYTTNVACHSDSGFFDHTDCQLDSQGRPTRWTWYDKNDQVIIEAQITYQGNRITQNYIENGQCVTTIESELDDHGYLLTHTVNGDLTQHFSYAYDSRGNMTQYCSYGAEGEIWQQQDWEYDSHNNISRMTRYEKDKNEEGLLEEYHYEYRYTYNDRNQLLTKIGYSDGEESSRTEYQYDDYGNLLSKTNNDPDDPINEIYTYTYDSQGNVLTKTSNIDSTRWEYTREETGACAARVMYDSHDQQVEIYSYSYTSVQVTKARAEELKAQYGYDIIAVK